MNAQSVNATPTKKAYLAIINDYDFNTAVCELIDNAIDVWWGNGRRGHLKISIRLSPKDDLAIIEDNSGGVPPDNLELLVQPGASTNTGQESSIGVFGVGSKRSAVSVAKQILIKTRVSGKPGRQIEYGDEWINTRSWDLQSVETMTCEEGHTIVELRKLRRSLSDDDVKRFIEHLQQTYAKLLAAGKFGITVNNIPITGVLFDSWAYPQGYEPHCQNVEYKVSQGQIVRLKITAGLLSQTGYQNGEWGVYFYCNDRLIQKAVRTPEVGFSKGEIGVPHHSHSASRVIVELKGPALLMPWASNKSGILFTHETFRQIQAHLINLAKAFAKLSKAFVKNWQDEVFAYSEGEVKEFTISPDQELKEIPLPIPPPQKPSYTKELFSLNAEIIGNAPNLSFFLDGMTLIDELNHKSAGTRNVFLIIFMEAILRLALKETDEESFESGSRQSLAKTYTKLETLRLPAKTLGALKALIEARAKIDFDMQHAKISAEEIEGYRSAIQATLLKMFKLKFPQRTLKHKKG